MLRTARRGSPTMAAVLSIVIIFSDQVLAERWSRQVVGETNSDWIPLQTSSVDKRQTPGAQPRVLNQPGPNLNQPQPFQSSFVPAETYPDDYIPQEAPRQLFLNSVPTGKHAFINPQNQPVRLTLTNQFNPLAQAFIPRAEAMPYEEFRQSIQAQFQQPSQFIPPVQLNNQFYNQINTKKMNSFGSTVQPLQQQKQNKQDVPRYVDGYKVENVSVEYLGGGGNKPPTSSISQVGLSSQQVLTERSSTNRPAPTTPSSTTVEKEEVQLLYVPLETLQSDKFDVTQFLKNSQRQEHIRNSVGSAGQINNQLYAQTTPSYTRKQTQLQQIQQDLRQQALNTQNLQSAFQFNQLQLQRQPKYSPQNPSPPIPFNQVTFPAPVITTPKSKKLKPHQPPLAVYMVHEGIGKAKLGDVLSVLKESSSISVLDSVAPNAPKVFIGPNNLRTPDKYVKFDLPYLSSIDGNRIQRKVDHLPFFVAPLSYKAPEGFAKIPFPAPHVGSVIVNSHMTDQEETRPESFANTLHSSPDYSTFPQSSTTEAFKTTIREPLPTKQSNFNYFPSATPNPNSSPQSTFSGFKSSFLPFAPLPESQYRPLQSTRQPESTIISSSRQPPSTFFSTSARPTVSFYSFTPEFNTLPTTHKPSTPLIYENRGHYITNAAIDTSRPPLKFSTVKEFVSEKPKTSPIPTTHSHFSTPYLIQPFSLKNPYEPENFRSSIRGNEIKHYNVDQPTQIRNQNNFNTFSQPQQKYPQFPIQQRPVVQNIPFSSTNDYSPRPYVTDPIPSANPVTQPPPPETEQPQGQFEVHGPTAFPDTYQQTYNSYSSPTAAEEDIPEVTQEIQYFTETPTTNEILTTTSTTTTTTTTTTTPAPTTRASFSRRPIHSRGRPRYSTTPRTETETTIRPTVRRPPIRERKPNSFRTKLESSRSTTSTTESSVDNSDFESAKKQKEYGNSSRYSNRYKTQNEEEKPTTEASSAKPTQSNRNQRLRSRGRVHFKTSDNYEGSDYVPKKKQKEGEGDLAYQRDVLHQNYPVTLSERISTLEIKTTTSLPSPSQDHNNGKIRIYETTGSTAKPYSVDDIGISETPEIFENQPVFQREQAKFLTHPDSYIAINGKSGSTPSSVDFSSVGESSTERYYPSTSPQYEEIPQSEVSNEEAILSDILNQAFDSPSQKEETVETPKQEVSTERPNVRYEPDVLLTEAPAPKFRTKLKHRSKLLPTLNTPKETENDHQSQNSYSFVTSRKTEESTESNPSFTRRNSINPITYRPAFNSRRTTMKIEEIEEELKARRTQVKQDSRSTTFKYPVYIPESTSATPSHDNDENDVTSTTKRSHFKRRRPIRPTTAAPETTTQVSSTTERSPSSLNKRVRVRSRLRTRPTTTQKTEISSPSNEESVLLLTSVDIPEEKYVSSTRRTPTQKYSTRGRQGAQKYFKRPLPPSERNQPSSTENTDDDDQTYYDSINRPEFVKYPEPFNPENGKAESHWSPKISQNTFHPIFNPNLIADEVKSDNFEYGTKLALPENSDIPDIITAGNPYEDVLIAVTPSSNNLQSQSASSNNKPAPTTQTKKEKQLDLDSDRASTFESVLEEVMRNLEEQDENEYNKDYVAVMKHEGGEIGEIPPESTVESNISEMTELNMDPEIKKSSTEGSSNIDQTPSSLDDNDFSSIDDSQISSTERQPRRRGGWRKIRVRPVNRDLLEGAESQFYKNSRNELVNENEKNKNTKQNQEKVKGEPKYSVDAEEQQPITTDSTKIEYSDVQTTQSPAVTEQVLFNENIDTFRNEEPDTEIPDLIAMEMHKQEVTFSPREKNYEPLNEQTTEFERQTEYLMSPTVSPVSYYDERENEEYKMVTESTEEVLTTIKTIARNEESEEKKNQTIQVTENITEEASSGTTISPETETNEYVTEKNNVESNTEPLKEIKSFSEAMAEILTELENTERSENTTKDSNSEDNQKEEAIKKIETPEHTTLSFNFFDPKSIIGTSVSTEVSHETEICYRGKCVKTKKQIVK